VDELRASLPGSVAGRMKSDATGLDSVSRPGRPGRADGAAPGPRGYRSRRSCRA
jgi:hypothetical protein